MVACVQGFCFNSQFFGLETSCSTVVSELNVWDVVSLKAGENCKSKQTVCFDSKPILFVVATKCRGNRIFIFCPILSKLKLGLELKQKFRSETTISEQFQPNPANVKWTFFHNCGI